jgi:hypothetical protein
VVLLNEPDEHARHDAWPDAEMKRPCAHAAHADAPVPGCT